MSNPSKLGVAAALSLVILMSAMGASASAKLCSTEGTGAACKTGHGWTVVGPVWLERLTPKKSATLQATNGTVLATCEEGEAEGEYTNGETGKGTVTKQVFSACSSELTATASTLKPWNTTAVALSAPNGYVEIAEVGYQVKFAGISCVYGGAIGSTGIQFVGGEKAETKVNFILPELAPQKILCPDTAVLIAEWTVEKPASSFLT